MLQRRTFLGLLAGFGAGFLSLARALTPPSWWGRSKPVQDAPIRSAQGSSSSETKPGIKITTTRRSVFRNSVGVVNDLSTEPDIFYLQGEWRRLESHRSYSRRMQPDGSTVRVYGPHVVTIVRPDLG